MPCKIKVRTSVINAYLMLTALCVVTSCGNMTSSSDRTTNLKAAHHTASHCEIFIDKITPSHGPHGGKRLAVYVQTIPDKLDSDLVEVGVHERYIETSAPHSNRSLEWRKSRLIPFGRTKNYWMYETVVSSNLGHTVYEAVFYAKTKNETHYWAKNSDDGNFVFDNNGFNNVMHASGRHSNQSSLPDYGVHTQGDNMRYYNPKKCR